jgi:cell division transport system ATP-binding protein
MDLKEVLHIEEGKLYAGKELIIKQINMSIVQGEFCYLFGSNGSGKTTFFKGIYGLEKLEAKKLTVLYKEIENLNAEELQKYRLGLGLISSFYPLIQQKTVYDNLEFVLKSTAWNLASERDARINELLKSTGMISKQQTLVVELSAGEQEIIKLVRAVLNSPKLILADGITSKLDSKSSDKVLSLLRDLAQKNGSSILLATHREELLSQYPARTYICSDRQISE